jgi:hypothetical protein
MFSVVSNDSTFRKKLEKNWIYLALNTKFYLVCYLGTWVLFLTLITTMYGFGNLSDKFIFNSLYALLCPLLPLFSKDSRIRLIGLFCCVSMGLLNVYGFMEFFYYYKLYVEAAPYSYANYSLRGPVVFFYDLFILSKLYVLSNAEGVNNTTIPIKKPTLREDLTMVITTTGVFGGAGHCCFTMANTLFPGTVKTSMTGICKFTVGKKPGVLLAKSLLKIKAPYITSAIIGPVGTYLAINEIMTRGGLPPGS